MAAIAPSDHLGERSSICPKTRSECVDAPKPKNHEQRGEMKALNGYKAWRFPRDSNEPAA